MRLTNRHILYLLSALVDALIIVGCFVASSLSYAGTTTGITNPGHQRWYAFGLYAVALYAVVLVAAYALLRVYGNVYYGRIRKMASGVLIANTVGIFVFGAGLYFIRLSDFSRVTLLRFYLSSTVLVLLKQWLVIQALYRWRLRTDTHVPVLVIGSRALAEKYASTISRDGTRHERVVGYVAATPTDEVAAVLGECLGGIDELDGILAGHPVEQVIIALEADEYPQVRHVMALADKYGIFVRIVPFYNDLLPRNPAIESLGGVKLVDVRTTALDNLFAAALKRAFDVGASAFILLLISPVMLVVALGVRLSSPGPIFFRQERIGKDRKPFMMLKFRSMRVNVESDTAWSTDEDPRKTKFGSFIRKYSLDELPQFLNVLRGDMSIIGPRPEIPHYVRQFTEEIPLYMLRHQVRPGITGWAQVNGLRGDTSIEERVRYDLYYIEHWSPWFDLRIFLRTTFGGFANSEKVVR